jgi:hypothetical protein
MFVYTVYINYSITNKDFSLMHKFRILVRRVESCRGYLCLMYYQKTAKLLRVSMLCFFLLWCNNPSGPKPPRCRGFIITLRHITLGRTPLDEWSARRRNLYLTTHNTHNNFYLNFTFISHFPHFTYCQPAICSCIWLFQIYLMTSSSHGPLHIFFSSPTKRKFQLQVRILSLITLKNPNMV